MLINERKILLLIFLIIYIISLMLYIIFSGCSERNKIIGFPKDTIAFSLTQMPSNYIILNRIDSICLPSSMISIITEIKNSNYRDQTTLAYYEEYPEYGLGIYQNYYKHIIYYSKYYRPDYLHVVSLEYPDKKNKYIHYNKNRSISYQVIKYLINSTFKKYTALYIRYTNKPLNFPDSPTAIYNLGINETTDTIYSSLQPWVIKKIFPEYKGVIMLEKIKKIVIDYQYNPKDIEFYHKIEIIKE